jgi:HEAT repeat protein
MSRGVLYAVAGALALVAAIVYWFWLGSAEELAPPEELLQQAMTAADEPARNEAAANLTRHGKRALPQLRELAAAGPSPKVRAIAIVSLGSSGDYDSMPKLLDGLQSEDPSIRLAAQAAVERLLGARFGYRAGDPPEEREAAAQRMRDQWERLSSMPGFWERVGKR